MMEGARQCLWILENFPENFPRMEKNSEADTTGKFNTQELW